MPYDVRHVTVDDAEYIGEGPPDRPWNVGRRIGHGTRPARREGKVSPAPHAELSVDPTRRRLRERTGDPLSSGTLIGRLLRPSSTRGTLGCYSGCDDVAVQRPSGLGVFRPVSESKPELALEYF